MTNYKMINAYKNACLSAIEADPEITTKGVSVVEIGIKAAIKSVWTTINVSQTEGLPSSEFSPSGKPWLCINAFGDWKSLIWDKDHVDGAFYDPNFDVFLYDIILFCDPADLTPQGGE